MRRHRRRSGHWTLGPSARSDKARQEIRFGASPGPVRIGKETASARLRSTPNPVMAPAQAATGTHGRRNDRSDPTPRRGPVPAVVAARRQTCGIHAVRRPSGNCRPQVTELAGCTTSRGLRNRGPPGSSASRPGRAEFRRLCRTPVRTESRRDRPDLARSAKALVQGRGRFVRGRLHCVPNVAC